jgi:hypothetical protein
LGMKVGNLSEKFMEREIHKFIVFEKVGTLL